MILASLSRLGTKLTGFITGFKFVHQHPVARFKAFMARPGYLMGLYGLQ